MIIMWNYRNVQTELRGFGKRPGVAQRVPGGLDSQIPMTFGT